MNALQLSGHPLRPAWWAGTGRALWYLLAYQVMGWLLFGAALTALACLILLVPFSYLLVLAARTHANVARTLLRARRPAGAGQGPAPASRPAACPDRPNGPS